MGPGFAAGTTDGPGFPGFQQGDKQVRIYNFMISLDSLLLLYFPWFTALTVIFCRVRVISDKREVETAEGRVEKAKPISRGVPTA